MPSTNGGNINFKINMTVDKNGLNQILKPLEQIQAKLKTATAEQLKNGLDKAANSAKQLESIINSSWNDKLGQLNLDKFNQSVKNSYGSVEGLKNSLSGAGTAGQSAFNALASEVLNTNLQLKESSKLLDDMATSMANTIKWGITSSIFNNITGSIQKAYYYAKDLDTSLGNIRIVTGDSADQMERFAKTANEAAKNLGRSTLDYTNAALSFYQQGLSNEQVQARTEVTLKAQNITGTGSEMADYLTAVWNGFGAQAQQVEGYVDKLAKVADSSASDMSELAIAMSKVASIANTMGVDVDQLTAQLATVIATTRQAPQAVGTAFKTIYSRLNDIKAGADDAEISLGNYSSKMAELGFNVLDANGSLRDTGQVMEQIGSRWNTLSKEQQVYLAQTMGGMRQVNQVMALFENWATYSDLLNDSLSAQGSLNQKNSIYLETVSAQMKTLQAETERTYSILFDKDALTGLTDVFKGTLSVFNDFIEGIGGGTNVFVTFGSTVASIFNKQITEAILQTKRNFELTFSKKAIEEMKNSLATQIAADRVGSKEYDTVQQQAIAKAAEKQANIYKEIYQVRKGLNDESLKELTIIQKQIGANTAKIESIKNYKSLLDQAGYSESMTTSQIEAAVETRKEQNQGLQTTISYLQRCSINNEALTEQEQSHVLTWEQIKNNIAAASNEGKEFVAAHETVAPSQAEINNFLQQQRQKLQEGKITLQEIIEALKAKVAYDRGDVDALEKENQALEKGKQLRIDQANGAIHTQNIVRGLTAIGQTLPSVANLIKVFSDETATAEQKVNSIFSTFQTGSMAIGSLFGAPGIAIGAVVSGMLAIVKNIPFIQNGLENFFKTTEEWNKQIQEINAKSQQTSETYRKSTEQVKSLREEYDELSKKSGNFTEEQQTRYNELIQKLSQYNQDIIKGYDDRGNAIVANNNLIDETLKKLDQQYEKQMRNAYAGENLETIRHTEDTYKQNKEAYTTAKNALSNPLGNGSGSIANAVGYAVDELSGNTLFGNIFSGITGLENLGHSTVAPLMDKALEEMYSALQELDQSELDYTSKIEQAQKIIDKYTKYFTSTDPLEELGGKTGFISRLDTSDIQNEDQRNLYIQTIQGNFEALKDFLITLENDYTQLENTSEQLQQKKEAFESSKAINVTDFFNVLKWSPEVNSQTGTTYNKEYEAIKAQFGEQWKEYGQQLTDSMLLSFLSGLKYGKDGQTFDELAAAAQNLLAGFADSELFSTQALDGVRQQIDALQSQGLDKTGKQYKQRIEEIINNFLSTIDLSSFFEGMGQDEKEQNKQALEAFLKSLFDLSDIQIDVDENTVTDAVTEAAQKREEDFKNAQQAIRQFLSESLGYTSKNGANGRFGIGTLKNVFGEDTDLQNIDEIINQINWQHFLDYTEQGMAAGQALKKVWKEAQQINQDLAKTNSNLDFNTVFNSDAVIQNLEATKKLSEEEENYLATLQQRDKKLGEIAYHEGRNSENYIARLKEIAGSAQQLYIDRQNALKAQAIAEMETQQAIANNTEASEEERAAAQQIVIQKKEDILKLDYDIARAEQAILVKANERAKAEYQNQKELLNKGKSALETLSGGGAITDSEQLLALAELENSNERLKQLGQSGNRNSEEYLNLLKEQLNVQAELVEQARLEQIEKAKTAIQESKIAQKEAERKLGSLQHSYDRAVGRGDDQAAAAILNQISIQEGIISSQKQTQVAKQAQLIGLQEQGKTLAESTAFSQQNRLQTLQTLSQTYKTISENLAAGTFAQLGKQDIQLLTELESKNSNLAQIASTLGRNTQQYAEALRNAILIQQQADLANAGEKIKDVDSRIKSENDSYNSLSAEQQLNQKQEHQAAINELLAERAGYLQDEYNIRAAIASLNDQRQADEDVKQEDLQQLTKYLYDYADAIQGVSDQVKENVEASADLAQAILRFDAALVQITSHYEDWEKQLTSGSVQEAAQAGEELQDVYSDLLDLPYENLSPDFTQSIDNLELLKQAANGSEQAYEALRQAAMEDILTQVGIDDASLAQFNTDLATIENEIANGIDDLEIGAYIDDTQAIQAMNELINAANLTAQQATDLLASMGVDAQVEQTTVPQNQKQAFISAVPTISSQPVDVPTIIPSFLGGIVGSTQVNVPTISYNGEAQTVQAPGEKTSTALRVTSAKKSSGGNFKFNQSSNGGGSRGRAARSPKRGGGGGRGKSPKKGGGSKAKTKEPKQQKALEDQQDRYHDINIEIKDIEKNLDKVQQVEKKLTGKDLIDNLNKQLDILDKQVDAQQRKLELQKQERDQLQNTLRNQGVTFNPDGTIANYATALSAKLAATNAAIAHYNTLSEEEQQKNKATMEAAKQDYEKFKDSIERYDELISEEMPDLEKSIRQIRDQQIEKQIQKFKISVDLQLDTSQAERDFNAFKKKVIDQVKDDDVLTNALYSFTDLSSYYKNGLDVIDSLTNQVNDTLGQLKEIDRNGEASVYGTDRAAALQDLKDYMDKLVDNLEDIEDLVDKIKDSIFDAIDVAQDSFDEQVNEYEYISDLIDHNVKMSQLLYGDDAYNTMAKYYQLQEKNNNNELDFLKQQKDLWFSRMVEQQTRMNNLDTGSRAFKQAEQRFEEYKQHWMDAINDLNNKLEDSLKNIIDKYANAIDSTFDKLINKVTNNKGLDSVEEEWELINKQADMYLDTINSVNEISKLQIAYQDAINDNDGNLAAQKSLNNMMQEQLAYLRDKDKLTQYDVDRANALLQIEIKRLALQQQRQNKTKLRLRRDSQGNYTYQYTVDEQGLNDAKQQLEEAEVSLYNMTKQAYKNNLDNYYDTVTDWQDKVKQVYKDTTLTVEQQQEKVAMLNKYYGDIINGLTQENENLKRFMMEDTFDELAKMYETNVDNYKAMTDAEKDLLMQDLIPYWNSGIQSMADVFAGQGGFIPVVNDTFNELADKTLEYQNSLDDLQNAAGADFNAINLAIDDTVYQAETLLDANNELINAYGEELDAVQRVVDQVDVLIDTYKTAKQAATAATTAAYKYWQQQHQNNARIAARQTVNSSSGRSSSSSSGSSSTSSSSSNNKNNTTNNAISSALNAAKSAASTALNAAKNAIQNSLNKTANTRRNGGGGGVNLIARLDSGGYTGSWGDSGKLAILHEKQIVLNKEDTSNILKSVSIVKTMDGLLENLRQNTLIKEFSNINGLGNNSNQTLDQQVRIQAHFPNVQNHSEIEQAFNNLVNRASQYAYRK